MIIIYLKVIVVYIFDFKKNFLRGIIYGKIFFFKIVFFYVDN